MTDNDPEVGNILCQYEFIENEDLAGNQVPDEEENVENKNEKKSVKKGKGQPEKKVKQGRIAKPKAKGKEKRILKEKTKNVKKSELNK